MHRVVAIRSLSSETSDATFRKSRKSARLPATALLALSCVSAPGSRDPGTPPFMPARAPRCSRQPTWIARDECPGGLLRPAAYSRGGSDEAFDFDRKVHQGIAGQSPIAFQAHEVVGPLAGEDQRRETFAARNGRRRGQEPLVGNTKCRYNRSDPSSGVCGKTAPSDIPFQYEYSM